MKTLILLNKALPLPRAYNADLMLLVFGRYGSLLIRFLDQTSAATDICCYGLSTPYKCSNRWLPLNVWRPSENHTDQEAIEITIIKLLLRSYYNIVRKNIEDYVPKAIMYFLAVLVGGGALAPPTIFRHSTTDIVPP
ncbi:hypothetical protein DM860_002660 [Cuscuta australis]|uniref:GED domain-containing protein n=1 Tax=Cuscuta australis TaxID=267555 RepID=A0A328CYZ2_9ASTE|nr:hypothetical protein DM860_002660 [Cuscuta australis]